MNTTLKNLSSKYIVFLLFFLISKTHVAQQINWSDSLQTIVKANISDSLKVKTLGSCIMNLVLNAKPEAVDFLNAMEPIVRKSKNAHYYTEFFYSKAVVYHLKVKPEVLYGYADSCIYFAEKANNLIFLVRGNRIKGQHLDANKRQNEAAAYIERAYEYCKKLNVPFETYRTLLALSAIEEGRGDFKKSVDYALIAADIAEKNSLGTLASVYIRLGKGYDKIADYNTALHYFYKAQTEAEKTQRIMLDQIYSQIGNALQKQHRYDEALQFYYRTDSIMPIIGSFREAYSSYNNIATIFTIKNQMDSAKKYYEKSIVTAEKGASNYLGRMYLNYSNFLFKKGEDSLALVYADKAKENAMKTKDLEVLPEIQLVKANVLAKTGKSNEAYVLYNDAMGTKDSINNVLKQVEVNEMLVKYETAKKENEIVKLNSEKKIQQLQLDKQKAEIAGNIAAAKQKQQEIDLLNQHQQIQDLKLSQQKEALALRELESQTKDRQLKINEQEKKLKDAELSQQRFSKNLILACGLVLLAFGALGFNLYRISTKRNNEREKFQLQNQLSEMKLEALRSQMNPHFIFNALNSINRYIIRSDRETASEYLIKFSKLMRLILENSKSSFIPLSNELEALRLYVEMELLRFDNKFDFNINIAADVLQDRTQIPPMVLQPFIENAIWHGLMNKKEKGMITVNVESKSADKLLVVIEDNGVGRQKANEQRNQYAHTGKSFGMQITRDRLAGINGTDKQFRIIDLTDNNNNPTGTRVELEITTIAA